MNSWVWDRLGLRVTDSQVKTNVYKFVPKTYLIDVGIITHRKMDPLSHATGSARSSQASNSDL